MNDNLANYRRWIERKLEDASQGGERHLYEDAAFVLDMYVSEQGQP